MITQSNKALILIITLGITFSILYSLFNLKYFDKNQNLNERDYGDLVGLNKEETSKKFGKEQVHIWRRSYDVSPPGGESLKNVVDRVGPYFEKFIQPHLFSDKNIIIVDDGSSGREVL